MKRVMIIGGSGSGKSTFAKRLGSRIGLPVVHIDPMYWAPGWLQRPAEETAKLARAAAATDRWIFEGNNSATMPERLARADTLIFLDIGTVRRMYRIVLRTLKYWGRSRPDMAEGCPERFDLGFLKWAAGYAADGRIRALAFLEQAPAHVTVIRLESSSQIEDYLQAAAVCRARKLERKRLERDGLVARNR